MSRLLRPSALAACLAAIAASSNARAQEEPVIPPKVGDVSMHGYFRLGYGVSAEKGRMTCFQAPDAPSKYRLGNECDQYGEFMLSAPAYVGADGVVASANVMIYGYTPTSIGHPQTYTPQSGRGGTGAEYGFAQFYLDMKGIPWLSGGNLWVGRRYYKREDFHVTDYFYWNPTGLGAGIEDIELGGGLKLSYAAFVVDGPNVTVAPPAPLLPSRTDVGIRNDIQLRGLELYPGGELQFGLDLVLDVSDNPAMHGGWGVTVRHVQQMLGGDNKLTLQYGQGAAIGFGLPDSLTDDPSDVNRLRVLDVLGFQATPAFGGQVAVIYQHDTRNDVSLDWLSVGGRVSLAFAEHAKVLLEVGHDSIMPEEGDTASLTKFTLAPAITAGEGFWSRPEFRLFYTLALFNDAARPRVDSGGVYAMTDKTVGSTIGVHAEGWW